MLSNTAANQRNESGGLVHVAGKEYRSAVRSRELIREAMLNLICEKNLNDITIKEVVEKARINRSTFYAHYSNLGDLVEELELELLTFLEEQLKQRSGATITPEDAARNIISLLNAYPKCKNGKSGNASFFEVLQRVLNQYVDLCLDEVPLSQREDTSYRSRLQLTVMFVYYTAINCDTGLWCYNTNFSQAAEDIITLCRKL